MPDLTSECCKISSTATHSHIIYTVAWCYCHRGHYLRRCTKTVLDSILVRSLPSPLSLCSCNYYIYTTTSIFAQPTPPSLLLPQIQSLLSSLPLHHLYQFLPPTDHCHHYITTTTTTQTLPSPSYHRQTSIIIAPPLPSILLSLLLEIPPPSLLQPCHYRNHYCTTIATTTVYYHLTTAPIRLPSQPPPTTTPRPRPNATWW